MIIDKVRRTIVRYNMLAKGDRVLVGVSGGPDSVALLYLLDALSEEYQLTIMIAHLDHMIRKGASEKDALFVRRLGEKLRLPVIVDAADIPRIARQQKLSLETAARNIRYDFFLKAAKECAAHKIALAHTADDQAETVLMRLIRGAGIRGLSGIPPVREISDVAIIRPLIETPKESILRFLKEKRVSFCEDLSNREVRYFRNRVRCQLIPLLEREFNPEIRSVLAKTAAHLRSDHEYLSHLGARSFKRYASVMSARVVLHENFLKEDGALRRIIVREAIGRVTGASDDISSVHWADLDAQLSKAGPWQLTWPGGVIIQRDRAGLAFCRRNGIAAEIPAKKESRRIAVPGTTLIGEGAWKIEARIVRKAPIFRAPRPGNEEYFDVEALRLPLSVRFKRPHDRMRPFGMKEYKRLKQLFSDEKVPARDRESVPVIFSGKRILWVCGVKRSDHARITHETGHILQLRLFR
ncbi:MAG: tRNA lysidine(34) synthetase TilS [Candidatus Omnitrophota bacterium]